MQPDRDGAGRPIDADAQMVLREIERRVGERNYAHWFHSRTSVSIDCDRLTIGVGSPFLLSWMQRQFRPAVAAAAQQVLGPSAVILFAVDGRLNGAADVPVPNREHAKPAKPAGRSAAAQSSTPRFADLEDFVVGPSNELALSAARQVSDAPGHKFNPLYLHGGVGVGKTHLLEGIYRRTRRLFPALRVVYLAAEAFTNYYTQALRERTLPGFRQRFRSVDVLMVDDVDFLDAKRGIQEEFLHTFKQLESQGGQIVLAAGRHPRLLAKLCDELTTRFLAGLVCRIEPPDPQTRRGIVERKAKRLKIDAAPEALAWV
ncbi:MAG: DnaA ATPase domain-containing protein, partial [Planctomycetaceae bacterium]